MESRKSNYSYFGIPFPGFRQGEILNIPPYQMFIMIGICSPPPSYVMCIVCLLVVIFIS